MSQAAALLVLRAHTGIHAGVGQEVGTVDLPIQRERVTNFPVLRGPSLKGALRQAAAESGLDNQQLLWLFGPETEEADKFGGALSVADARLVLFPMRSLRGTFAWLTCPFALERLRRDLVDSKLDGAFPLAVPPTPPQSMGLVPHQGSQIKHESRQGQKILQMVVVENHGIDVLDSEPLSSIATQLTKLVPDPAELKARLALIEDELFQNLVTFGTEVVTRVHLNDETKTVLRGQLWTEELLPAESVLAALLVCHDAREKDRSAKAADLLKALTGKVKGRFQVGGNETVGYGVCHASWVGPAAPSGNGAGAKKEGK